MRTDNHGNKIGIIDKGKDYEVSGKLLFLLEEIAYSMRIYTLSEKGQAKLRDLIEELCDDAWIIDENH